MVKQRMEWEKAVQDRYLPQESQEMDSAWNEFGTYHGAGDYGHTSPNSQLLVDIGFTRLLERIDKAAQKNPEKYANLQVRVCGWSAYFVNLSKAEQDAFIQQAENAS